jgi:hypothetical protein
MSFRKVLCLLYIGVSQPAILLAQAGCYADPSGMFLMFPCHIFPVSATDTGYRTGDWSVESYDDKQGGWKGVLATECGCCCVRFVQSVTETRVRRSTSFSKTGK